MSLKAELETWASALVAYDAERFDEALELFSRISESSKILTNIGLIYATVGDHDTAVRYFQLATEADQYLAVAYFQCGVSNFLLERFDLAYKDFEDSLLYLRGNEAINYEQLGLKFKLYSAEVLFNKGLSQINLGRSEAGMTDLEEASRFRVADTHDVIDEAIQDGGQGYTVFSIPVGVLYRPSESKLRNAKQKDYMGKAKLVATADESEAYTTFTGVTRLKQGITPKGTYVPEDEDKSSDYSVQSNRSVIVPPPTNVDQINPVPLKRSKTTISVPINRNRGLGSETSQQPPLRQRSGPGRSMTTVGRGPGPAREFSAPTRGLSLRSPRRVPSLERIPASQSDYYGDRVLQDYTDNSPGSPDRQINTFASWAKNTPNSETPSPMSRSPSTRAPPSSYTSNTSNSGLRRRGTGIGRQRSAARRKPSYEEEEEEGYGSGDYDDVSSFPENTTKIRVRVNFRAEVRGLVFPSDGSFETFMNVLSTKFKISSQRLEVKFKDEEGGWVSLKDEMDYDMALETAANGKLEISCAETRD